MFDFGASLWLYAKERDAGGTSDTCLTNHLHRRGVAKWGKWAENGEGCVTFRVGAVSPLLRFYKHVGTLHKKTRAEYVHAECPVTDSSDPSSPLVPRLGCGLFGKVVAHLGITHTHAHPHKCTYPDTHLSCCVPDELCVPF